MDAHRPQPGRALPRHAPRLRILLLLLLLASSLAPGCRKHEPVLADLESLDQFKAQFNEDTGKPRIVLLLSPT